MTSRLYTPIPILKSVFGLLLLMGCLMVAPLVNGQASDGGYLEDQLAAKLGSDLRQIRLTAFQDVKLVMPSVKNQPARDPDYVRHREALRAGRLALPQKILKSRGADGAYQVHYLGPDRRIAFYDASGKTEAIAFLDTETFPQKETRYRYTDGKLESVVLRLSPKDVYVFNSQGELNAGPQGAGELQASQDPFWQRPSFEHKVVEIGQKLLESNRMRQVITFQVVNEADIANAYASPQYGAVRITRSLLRYMSSDDELAAILAHEVAHVQLGHYNSTRDDISWKIGGNIIADTSRRNFDEFQAQETAADLLGLKLMTRAGYNPQAMVSVLSKISSDSLEALAGRSTHPAGSERLQVVQRQVRLMQRRQQALQEDSQPEPSASGDNLPAASATLHGWQAAQVWGEVEKHRSLAKQAQNMAETFPRRDPDYEENRAILAGKRSARSGQLLRHSRYTDVYAKLLGDRPRLQAGYAVLFQPVRAYPGYDDSGSLRRVSLCSQADYPRTCCMVNPDSRAVTGWSFELSEGEGFHFSPEGKYLGLSREGQTYDMAGRPMKEIRLYGQLTGSVRQGSAEGRD